VWGRGATDCKNILIGQLESIEALLTESFAPKRTVLLAYGHDKEVGGHSGATALSKAVEERYGRDSVEMIVDEGGSGLADVYGRTFAMPATCVILPLYSARPKLIIFSTFPLGF